MYPNPQDKASLRDYWKKEHPKFLSKLPNWSLAICQHIADSQVFKAARQVAVFRGRDWEVNLEPLWKLAPQKCYFPRVNLKIDEGMDFYSVVALTDLKVGYGGVAEPPISNEHRASPFLATDLILVPGLAFDIFGARIGHGKGFYDRFLAGPSKNGRKWGVTYSPQVRNEAIIQGPKDVKIDALVTENGIIYF